MDSLKTLHSDIFNQPVKNQLQGQLGNKDLWLKALEKNGLYSSLEKFEVIEGPQRFEVLASKTQVSQQIKNENNTESLAETKSKSNVEISKLENSLVKNNAVIGLKNQSVVKGETILKVAEGYQYLYSLFVANNKKGLRLASLYKGYEMNMPWLSKNTTITKASSGLEVWVRDSSLSEDKLSNTLRHLRYSMADLGASLSKVTINGKVVFYQKNHHSSMEG